jgi:hypothetical protein
MKKQTAQTAAVRNDNPFIGVLLDADRKKIAQ